MKIADIRTYCLSTPLETPFAYSQGWVKARGATLVEVITDSGLTGWGESICMGLQPPQIAAAAIEHALKPILIGADPRDLEVLWHRMYHHTRDYGQKGAMMGALSGVDIALWDIAGKSLGVPVHRLLGGAFRTRVEAYATGFYRIQGQGEAKRLAAEATAHWNNGFRAMKVKLGFGIDDDLAVMQAVCDALEGESATLMIDTAAQFRLHFGARHAMRAGQRGRERPSGLEVNIPPCPALRHRILPFRVAAWRRPTPGSRSRSIDWRRPSSRQGRLQPCGSP